MLEIDHENGTVNFGGRWRGPAQSDYAAFVNDHGDERWFVSRLLNEWPAEPPADDVAHWAEQRVEKLGPDLVARLFEYGEIEWAEDVSPVTGEPYLQLTEEAQHDLASEAARVYAMRHPSIGGAERRSADQRAADYIMNENNPGGNR